MHKLRINSGLAWEPLQCIETSPTPKKYDFITPTHEVTAEAGAWQPLEQPYWKYPIIRTRQRHLYPSPEKIHVARFEECSFMTWKYSLQKMRGLTTWNDHTGIEILLFSKSSFSFWLVRTVSGICLVWEPFCTNSDNDQKVRNLFF